MIKRAEFTELPMPDSVIRRVEYWADKDKQEARDSLSFRNRNNEHFSWDDDLADEPLVEDNAPEPPIAPFPDIPTEMPGIELEHDDTPAIAPDDEPALEDRLRLASANADIEHHIIPDSAENDRSGNTTYHNYIYNVQNNQRNTANVHNNIVLAEEGEIEDAEAEDEHIPKLQYRDDDSDDEEEDYVPSDQEDIEMEDIEIEDDEDCRGAAAESVPERTTRSGRTVKQQNYYHDEYQLLQSRGKWTEADAIE